MSEAAASNCLFCRIVGGQIPVRSVYQDADVMVFHDIHPAAPLHLLIVPKRHLASLIDVDYAALAPAGGDVAAAESQSAADQQLLGKMLFLAPRLAREQGAVDGFRVVVNNGRDGGQEVLHLHFHVLGGPRPWRQMSTGR